MVNIDVGPSNGSSGSISAINIGNGFGWFKQIVSSTILQFKSLILGSNKLSVTNNANDITIDVVEANLNLGNMGGVVGNTQIGAGAVDTSNIANNAVTSALISAGAVGTSQLGSNVVTDANIALQTSSKISITNKAQLPADSVYLNDTQTLTNKTVDSITNFLKNLGSTSQLIFTSGSTYYLRDNKTGIVTSNTSPDTIFQTALTNGGNVYVFNGTYTFSGTFTGLNFPINPTRCNFIMDVDAILTIPNGYAGYVFRFMVGSGSVGCSNNILMGGLIQEAGSIQRNWTCVLFQATTDASNLANGCFHNTVRNVQINYPNIGIQLYIDSSGTLAFVNSNYFISNLIYGAKTAFFDFNMGATYVAGNNGFYRNRFDYNLCQGTNTVDATTGFRNIRHKDNSFHGNYVADFGGTNLATSTIHQDADYTTIIGGTMDSFGFVDNSTTQTTLRRTENTGLTITRLTPGNSGTNLDVIPTGSTLTWSWWNSNKTERFYIQKNATQYLLDFVRQSSSGALRPVLFRQYDVPNSSPVESFRIDTDSITKFAKPIDLSTQSTPANPATGASRIYVKTIDVNNDGIFYLIKKNGAFREGQIV